jgi:hypothetical protein
VLVVARTTAALTRLLDVVALLSPDPRVQIVFTLDDEHPAMFSAGTDRLLEDLETRTMPWSRARETRFDLVLSASENDGLADLDAPILLLTHGLGFQKHYPGGTVVAGLDPERLVAGGRIVPAAIGLSHPAQRRHLATEILARTVVVGDPCLGRMLASRHRTDAYRAALDATGRRLVVLVSTWGPDSLLGAAPRLPERLVARLPLDGYRVVVVLHPGVWAAHGPWQVRAWLAGAGNAGVRVMAPHAGWQAALLAADCVLADHGSLGVYAAVAGVPLLLGPRPSPTTVPGSAAAVLAEGPRVDPDGDLRGQIDEVVEAHHPDRHRAAAAVAVESPAESAPRLRAQLYRMLDLPEPPAPAEFPPLPVPEPRPAQVAAWVAGVETDGGVVTVTRYPDLGHGDPHEELPYRHLAARLELAGLTQVTAAAVLCSGTEPGDDPFGRWPHAVLLAVATPGGCRVRTRAGDDVHFRAEPGVDPWVFASWAYWRLRRGEPLSGPGRLLAGGRLVSWSR